MFAAYFPCLIYLLAYYNYYKQLQKMNSILITGVKADAMMMHNSSCHTQLKRQAHLVTKHRKDDVTGAKDAPRLASAVARWAGGVVEDLGDAEDRVVC